MEISADRTSLINANSRILEEKEQLEVVINHLQVENNQLKAENHQLKVEKHELNSSCQQLEVEQLRRDLKNSTKSENKLFTHKSPVNIFCVYCKVRQERKVSVISYSQ